VPANRRAALLIVLSALGCGRDAPATLPASGSSASPAPALPSAATDATRDEIEGIRYLERITGGKRRADKLPLIIAIHGLGDRPEHFVRLFDEFASPARLIVPYGEPYGGGFSWFPVVRGASPDALAAGIERAARRLDPMIRALAATRPTTGKPIVTGFSQGGMLSFAIAVLSPSSVSAAFPVSGLLPSPLWPSSWPQGTASPRIEAFHGEADRVVSVLGDRQGVAKLRELGLEVVLREYAGVPHTVNAEMRRDLYAALEAASARAQAATDRGER
jgi:phospholipase/carboxylesterase